MKKQDKRVGSGGKIIPGSKKRTRVRWPCAPTYTE